MSTETTIAQAEYEHTVAPVASRPMAVWIRPGWLLGKLLLLGLLLTYLVGWVHDFQRIRRLEAEPTPPSKVITKFEAWDRIYSPARHAERTLASPASNPS